MESVAEIMDETDLSIYEAKSLLESLCTVLECGSLNNQECSRALLLARLTADRIKNLQNTFSSLEDKIYKQILLK